jgi:4-amino-4-deoxy-L-arabinose transferase-like glycosyltransferase
MSEATGLLQGMTQTLRRHKWLLVILCVAFLLRLGFMLKFTPVISGDGCEYIRMGMELREGEPLTGVFEWPETMYGTFYPVLIAGVSHLGLSAEHAAKLLALLFGTALVLLAFLLAKYVYGERVAHYVATLFAIFPVYVALSGSVFNETIYLTLWAAGIYCAIRALDSFRARDFLLAGMFFGFSTLSRPEAFAYPIFIIGATGIVALFRRAEWLKALRGAAVLFAAWFVLMIPYAVFLHAHTGQYRFEGKWNINYTLGNRIDSGMGYFQAGLGLDDKLQPVGPLLDSSLYAAYTPYPHSIGDKLRYFGRAIRRNWPVAYAEVFSVDFGGPVMMLLVVLGLFGASWSVKRLRHEFIFAAMALSIVVLMLTAAHLEHRYAYPLPAIVLLWAGAGLECFHTWITRTLTSWGGRAQALARKAGQAGVAGVGLALLVFSIVGVRTDFYFMIEGRDYLGIKQAGLWLGAHDPGPKRIFGFEGRVAYYSGGTNIIFPYADAATTLKYLESKNIDYIVLDSMDVRSVPTLGQWFANGVPDSRARLIYESTDGSSSDRIRVYSWDGSRISTNATSSRSEKE